MTIEEVLEFYGNGYQFRKKTGISCTSLYNWRRRGFIPVVSQMRIEVLSKGALKANLAHAKGEVSL